MPLAIEIFLCGLFSLALFASIGALGCFLQMLQEQREDWDRDVWEGWRKSRLEEVIASRELDALSWCEREELLSDLRSYYPHPCPIHGKEAERCGRMGHMAWTGWKGASEVIDV